MLSELEPRNILKHRNVEFLSPAHDWTRVQLHCGNSRTTADESYKQGAFIDNNCPSSTEALDHMNPLLHHLLDMEQLLRLPANIWNDSNALS